MGANDEGGALRVAPRSAEDFASGLRAYATWLDGQIARNTADYEGLAQRNKAYRVGRGKADDLDIAVTEAITDVSKMRTVLFLMGAYKEARDKLYEQFPELRDAPPHPVKPKVE